MAYATKYRIEFDTLAGEAVRIDIQEDAFAGTITNLQAGSASLRWSGSDQSKAPGIKPSTLSFSVLSGDVTASDFLTTEDTDLKCLLYLNDALQWSGWMDSEGLQEVFLDPPYYIELQAHDGLKLLRNAELKNLSDQPLWISYKLTDFFAFALNQTKLGLNFWTWIDIYPDGKSVRSVGSPSNDPFYYSFVDSKTFETDTTIEALSKILTAFGCQLFQARGEWHIVYVEDWIRDLGLSGTEWNSSGVAQGIAEDQRFNITLGLRESFKLLDADAVMTWQRANKSVRLNYAYEVPTLIRNIDLNDSVFDSYITPDAVAKYEFTYWTFTGAEPFVVADLDIDSDQITERDRRVQWIKATGLTTSEVTSTSAAVQPGDKFKFTFNYGFGDPVNNWNGALKLDIKLTSSPPIATKWLDSNGEWQTTRQNIVMDDTDPSSAFYTIENPGTYTLETAEAIPDGALYIEIIFVQDDPGGGVAPVGSFLHAVWDMQYDYQAYAAFPNRIAAGHYNKVTQTGNFTPEYENEVFLSDSRNVVFKGTIYDANSDILRYWFHNGITEEVRFSTLIANAYYKLYHRNFKQLDIDVLNIKTGSNFVTPLDTVFFSEIKDSEFGFGNLELDLINNRFTASVVELHDTADFAATGTNEFKFISPQRAQPFEEPEAVRVQPPTEFGAIGTLIWRFFGNGRKKK